MRIFFMALTKELSLSFKKKRKEKRAKSENGLKKLAGTYIKS